MDNITLFSIGLAVCFLFAGGMLSHAIISQKLLDEEELKAKDSTEAPSKEAERSASQMSPRQRQVSTSQS